MRPVKRRLPFTRNVALPGGCKLIGYFAGDWTVVNDDSSIRAHVTKPIAADKLPPTPGKPWRVLAPQQDNLNRLKSWGDYRLLNEAALRGAKVLLQLDAIARLGGMQDEALKL